MNPSDDSSTPSIRWILFDYGGVVAEEGFVNVLGQLSQHYGHPAEELPHLAMDAVYESGYVTGQASEAAFWHLLRQRFSFSESDEEISARILRAFALRIPVLQLNDGLRRLGYHTAILSDQTDWLKQLDERDRFFSHFERIFNSYELGKGKRDASLFTEVAAELSIDPSQAIFIDDNPENVRRAIARGLHGLHYVDLARLQRDLASLLNIPIQRLREQSGKSTSPQVE